MPLPPYDKNGLSYARAAVATKHAPCTPEDPTTPPPQLEAFQTIAERLLSTLDAHVGSPQLPFQDLAAELANELVDRDNCGTHYLGIFYKGAPGYHLGLSQEDGVEFHAAVKRRLQELLQVYAAKCPRCGSPSRNDAEGEPDLCARCWPELYAEMRQDKKAREVALPADPQSAYDKGFQDGESRCFAEVEQAVKLLDSYVPTEAPGEVLVPGRFATHVFSCAFNAMCVHQGAANLIEFKFTGGPFPFILTIQRVEGRTPSELITLYKEETEAWKKRCARAEHRAECAEAGVAGAAFAVAYARDKLTPEHYVERAEKIGQESVRSCFSRGFQSTLPMAHILSDTITIRTYLDPGVVPAAAVAALTKDRDAWKARAEAAEAELLDRGCPDSRRSVDD